MKMKHIVKIICALITAIATVLASVYAGTQIEKNNQQDIQSEYIKSQTAKITGDNNTVTINDVDSLLTEYNNFYDENKSLRKQNIQYIDDLTELKNKYDKLKSLSDDTPDVELSDLALKVDGDPISINSSNARAIIDGKEYFSREITEKLLSENQSIKVKDDTLYIGKIIAEQASLFDQYMMDKYDCDETGTYTDSFGNDLPNSIRCRYNGAYIIYNLNNKYKYLKLSYAASDDTDLDVTGVITIKADDNIVFTSKKIEKTIPLKKVVDIPISNCSILKIEYSSTSSRHLCIISDAIVYN